MSCLPDNGEELGLTATVNHDASMICWPCLLDRLCSRTNMLGSEVGALGTTAEDDMYILVSTSLDNSGKTLLCHTHEGVGV